MKKPRSTYDRLVHEMPSCLYHDESLFPTVERLQYEGIYEIDAYESDREACSHSKRDIAAIRRWLDKVRAAIRAEGGEVMV